MNYHHVFVAGTFDGLHKGHQAILTRAFAEGERVTVGITPDEFVEKVKRQKFVPGEVEGVKVKSYEERRKFLTDWLEGKKWLDKATVIAIADQFEPAASDPDIDALVVTPHNRTTGEEINDLRNKRSLKALALLEVPIVPAEDMQPISSTRMRNGDIDASGRLTLPDNLRPELAKPLGKLLTGFEIDDFISQGLALRTQGEALKKPPIITVGDVVTKTFLEKGVTPDLAIIDLRVGRVISNDLLDFSQKGTHVQSGPGYISKEAIQAIGQWAETLASKGLPAGKAGVALKGSPVKNILVVDGEEDLLVLPAILAAPVGSFVYYGQPPLRPPGFEGQAHQGIVEVEVTLEKKQAMTELFKKFIQS